MTTRTAVPLASRPQIAAVPTAWLGQPPGFRFAYLKDPEGNLIELMQPPPSH